MTCFRCGKKFDKYTGRHLSNNSNLCLDFKITLPAIFVPVITQQECNRPCNNEF